MSKRPFNFPTDSESVRNRNTRKAPQPSLQKRYEEISTQYLTDSFTNQCYKQIIAITHNAAAQAPELKAYPIKEILMSISKRLLMNELEFLFLGCLLDELKWQYTDPTIQNFAATLKPLLAQQPSEDTNYKCIELYLLLSAYSVKVYLNEDIKIYESNLTDMLPKFQQIFHTWGSKFAMTALSTNPKKLNRKYVETTIKRSHVEHEDLNKKVNELVETNPASGGREEDLVKIVRPPSDIQDDQLPPPPVLIPGNSTGSMRRDSYLYDMIPSWNRDSYIDFPLLRQTSDCFNQLPVFGRMTSNESDRDQR